LLAFIVRIRHETVRMKEKLQDIGEKSGCLVREIKYTEMESGSRGKKR